MDFSCECTVLEDDDADKAQFCEVKIRKARSEHFCSECQRKIQPKEIYEHCSGVWGSKWEKYKTCSDCLSVRKVFFNSWVFTMLWDDLYDHIHGCYGEIPEKLISQLTPTARTKVCNIIQNFWENQEKELGLI